METASSNIVAFTPLEAIVVVVLVVLLAGGVTWLISVGMERLHR